MKRLIALLVLALLTFYGAWPAYNAYQVSSAIKARDNDTLERKISFPDVRESLKPAASQKVGEVYDRQLASQVGPAGAAVVAQIKANVVPRIVDTALTQLVTPANLVRVANDGRSFKESAERILQEQIGKIGLPGIGGGIQLPGGLGQIGGKINIPGLGAGAPAAEPAAQSPSTVSPSTAPAQPPRYTLANIKRFGFLGPLAFEIGVAKDAKAADAEVTVEMRFIGGDWRVVGVRPRL